MVVAVHFILCAELVLILDWIISSKENAGLYMTKKQRLIWLNNFTLLLKSIVWINRINYPDTIVINRGSRSTSYLLLWNWCTNSGCIFITAKAKCLSEQVFVGLNAHFLTIANILITTKHINIIHSSEFENWSSHWPWILTFASTCNRISFWYVRALVTDIDNEPALSILTINHNRVSPFEFIVSPISPWNLSIRLLILGQSFTKWQIICSFLCVVVAPLNMVEFEILVPVSDTGLVGILGATLQLLSCVLHIYFVWFELI